MCKEYEDYKTLTRQAAAALKRGEADYARELLEARNYPSFLPLVEGSCARVPQVTRPE